MGLKTPSVSHALTSCVALSKRLNLSVLTQWADSLKWVTYLDLTEQRVAPAAEAPGPPCQEREAGRSPLRKGAGCPEGAQSQSLHGQTMTMEQWLPPGMDPPPPCHWSSAPTSYSLQPSSGPHAAPWGRQGVDRAPEGGENGDSGRRNDLQAT